MAHAAVHELDHLETVAVISGTGTMEEIEYPQPDGPSHYLKLRIAGKDAIKNLTAVMNKDVYQREVLPEGSLDKLREAMSNNDILPPLQCVYRGRRIRNLGLAPSNNGAIIWEILIGWDDDNIPEKRDPNYKNKILEDEDYQAEDWCEPAHELGGTRHTDLYALDGGQRTYIIREALADGKQDIPAIELIIFIGMTLEWETRRFTKISVGTKKIHANTHVKNSPEFIIKAIKDQDRNPGSLLYGRLSWDQKLRRNELFGSSSYCRILIDLHKHICKTPGSGVEKEIEKLQQLADTIGTDTVLQNAEEFFLTIHQLWGFKELKGRKNQWHLRDVHLRSIAQFFSEYIEFWNDEIFFLNRKQFNKLKKFADMTIDPTIRQKSDPYEYVQKACGTLNGQKEIKKILVRHMNSYRDEGNKLVSRENLKDRSEK